MVLQKSSLGGAALTSVQPQLREQKGAAQEQTGEALGRNKSAEGCPSAVT